jgi:methyl-accepting chemotaxis protein
VVAAVTKTTSAAMETEAEGADATEEEAEAVAAATKKTSAAMEAVAAATRGRRRRSPQGARRTGRGR